MSNKITKKLIGELTKERSVKDTHSLCTKSYSEWICVIDGDTYVSDNRTQEIRKDGITQGTILKNGKPLFDITGCNSVEFIESVYNYINYFYYDNLYIDDVDIVDVLNTKDIRLFSNLEIGKQYKYSETFCDGTITEMFFTLPERIYITKQKQYILGFRLINKENNYYIHDNQERQYLPMFIDFDINRDEIKEV